MPKEYNISKISRFGYSYEHIAGLLSVFSQTPVCKVMFIMDHEKEVEVRRIRNKLKDTPSFVISKALALLKTYNIIEKVEKTYVLHNNIFFRELSKSASEVYSALGEKPSHGELSPEELKEVAELFSGLFFDNTSNILIHMLTVKPRKFNEIEEIYRSAHGYIPVSTLRYHLSTRRGRIGKLKIRLFDFKNRNYSLSEEGRKIHDSFDRFLKSYEHSIEAWIHDMWNTPLRELTRESMPLADPRDSVHKLLRILHSANFVIAFSTEPKGIITMKNVMNTIGVNLGHPGFLANTSVEDLMSPIDPEQVLSGDTTLAKIFKKENGFAHNHYIVDLGKGVFNVLSIARVLKRFSVT